MLLPKALANKERLPRLAIGFLAEERELPNVDHRIIVLGLIAGFIASKIVNKQGEGLVMDIVLGIVGAIVGGWLFATLGHEGVNGFNLYSMFVAVIGAIVVLLLYHAIIGRRVA
jgi:uncharacterized membrane protein YeaQ/YmgE (transglycosylase-associated protein family)